MPNPIENKDFTEAAGALTTPPAGEAVAASSPVPTDRYLSTEDVAATKAAEAAPAADATATPATPVVAAATDAAATATPAGKEPPADRWDTILENARKKARADVEGEYAWAKDLNRDDVEATRKWISLGNQNPLLALDQLVQGIIKSNPSQQDQIEHYFKSIMKDSGPAAAAAVATSVATAGDADPCPPPDIPTDTSNGVPVVYSDKQMVLRDAWFKRQITKEVKADLERDLAPLRAEHQATTTKRQEDEAKAATDAYTERAIGAIATQPGYEKYKAEIAAAYNAIPLSDTTRTEGEKLRDAYLTVIASKMSEEAVADAVASVNRRAEAGTVNPSSQSASTPFDYKTATWEQALRHEFNSAALGR